jgi:hypothetical protein
LRLCVFARKKKKEARAERQEARAEIEPFAVRFLCACLPQAGLCAFASKKKKEARCENQETRLNPLGSCLSLLGSIFQIPTAQKLDSITLPLLLDLP